MGRSGNHLLFIREEEEVEIQHPRDLVVVEDGIIVFVDRVRMRRWGVVLMTLRQDGKRVQMLERRSGRGREHAGWR
eukprot:767354-Hanusia_phi.AAC.3